MDEITETNQGVENAKESHKANIKAKKSPKSIWVNCVQAYYPIIVETMESFGYKITDNESKATLLWINTNGSIEIASSLLPWQFYNHFPGTWTLARKVELAKNIDIMSKFLPNDYCFYPRSFVLPFQFQDLKAFMLSIPKKSKRTFIIKPDRGSLGKGIFLSQEPDVIEEYTDPAIAQRYITPFLIDGLKFDLRIYVLITSIEPLRLYIHDEGIARFCTEKYEEPVSSNLEHVFSHLTNYSVNKKNENFKANFQADENEKECGHKRSLNSIFEEIDKRGYNSKNVKSQIDEIVRLTIASAQPFIASQYRIGVTQNDGKSRCFEILGFDILIDQDTKPWLLEVNCKPSMAVDSEFDRQIKTTLIHGALKIIQLQPNFKKLVKQRIKAVSQRRMSIGKTNAPISPLFDFSKEFEASLETKWRLLYPLKKGDNSAIETALKVSKENMGKAIQTKNKKDTAPQIKENITPKRHESVSNNSLKTNKNIQPVQLKKPKSPETKISANKSCEQFFDSLNETKSKLTTDKTLVSLISTPNLKLPFGHRSSIPTRTKTISSPDPESLPIYIQFRACTPLIINEEEERERIRFLRKQQQNSLNMKMANRVRQIMGIMSESNTKNDNQILFGNRIFNRNPKAIRGVAKPLIIYKQFSMNDN